MFKSIKGFFNSNKQKSANDLKSMSKEEMEPRVRFVSILGDQLWYCSKYTQEVRLRSNGFGFDSRYEVLVIKNIDTPVWNNCLLSRISV